MKSLKEVGRGIAYLVLAGAAFLLLVVIVTVELLLYGVLVLIGLKDKVITDLTPASYQ